MPTAVNIPPPYSIGEGGVPTLAYGDGQTHDPNTGPRKSQSISHTNSQPWGGEHCPKGHHPGTQRVALGSTANFEGLEEVGFVVTA